MGHDQIPAYGLWAFAAVNAAVFVLFAASFLGPRPARNWRSLGPFSAFVVALFAEMYGFPLTLYLLTSWLGARFGGLDPFAHDSGHLWWSVLGMGGDPHVNPIHVASNLVILGGFILIAWAWSDLHEAQRAGRLATSGAYARVRHPQYVGFILIMTGFLLQWPTLPTLAMFPILVAIYVRLGRREEADAIVRFGDPYRAHAERVPGWLPRISSRRRATS
jgi:protein-S-isoprenylcysteine O-methyltransferase Ste14